MLGAAFLATAFLTGALADALIFAAGALALATGALAFAAGAFFTATGLTATTSAPTTIYQKQNWQRSLTTFTFHLHSIDLIY